MLIILEILLMQLVMFLLTLKAQKEIAPNMPLTLAYCSFMPSTKTFSRAVPNIVPNIDA